MIKALGPALAAWGFFSLAPSSAWAKAPPPLVLLYPATPGDVAALVDLRTRLRLDDKVGVLTYDPDSAAIQRVAADDAHPEWAVSAPTNDDGRMTLARALGAAFYAVVSPGRTGDTTHVELVETAPAARSFDWTGTNREYGVRAIESQVADSLAHPPAYDAVAAAPVAAAPVAAAPVAAAPVAAAPVAAAPVAAAPVAAAPVAAAPVAAAPVAAAPVAAAPVAAAPVAAAPVAAAPVAAAPVAAAPVAAAPVAAAPVAAAPVAVASTPTPIVIKVPASVPPVPQSPAALLPPVKAPLPLPVQVVQSTPLTLTLPVPQAAPVPAVEPTRSPLAPNPGGTGKPLGVPPLAPPQSGAGARPIPAPRRDPQIAMVPRPALEFPEPASLTPPSLTPPSPIPQKPAEPEPVRVARPNGDDLAAIAPMLARGDSALDGGDFPEAIALYRQAINEAPLNVVPRLKLAQAYQKNGMGDKALDEARRALQVAPDSGPVQQLLSDLDQQNGTSEGTLIRYRAEVERRPEEPAAHSGLADALWNSGDLSGAESEYKAAKALAPAGDHAADSHLAQLYAAEARYEDCLAALRASGGDGYALASRIVRNRAETISSTLGASRGAFAAGKSTREQFYDDAKKLSAEAQALAGFVAQVTPPAPYRLSHLHRMLATNLLAQEAATLVTFIETGDAGQSGRVAQLEKAADTEMLTAQATEEKLGLWDAKKQ